MSTGTLQVKDKNNTTVWILSMFFSPYRATEYSIDCRYFVSKKLAQEAMRREARRLYKNSAIIQEARDKYYNEYEMEIHFGENDYESDYKREFGFCEITFTRLEDKESGDEVPSSTDDESDDDDKNDDDDMEGDDDRKRM